MVGIKLSRHAVKHGGLDVLCIRHSTSGFPSIRFWICGIISKTATIIIDATWWHQRRQLQYYMDIWQSITKTSTSDSSIAADQKESMESSSAGYRRWSGVVCCPNSGKPSSPYCSCMHHLLERSCRPLIPMSSVGTRLDNTCSCALPCLYVWVRHCARRMTVSMECQHISSISKSCFLSIRDLRRIRNTILAISF